MQTVLVEDLQIDRISRTTQYLEENLQCICKNIKQASIYDLNASRIIYTHLFELLCDTEENLSFQLRIEQYLHCAIQHKLIVLFNDNVNMKEESLSQWITFVQEHFEQFRLFYDRALQPFIVFTQDEHLTPYLKEYTHPFSHCQKQLESHKRVL